MLPVADITFSLSFAIKSLQQIDIAPQGVRERLHTPTNARQDILFQPRQDKVTVGLDNQLSGEFAVLGKSLLQITQRFGRRPVECVERRQIQHKDILWLVSDFHNARPVILNLICLIRSATALVLDNEGKASNLDEDVNGTVAVPAINGLLALNGYRLGKVRVIKVRKLIAPRKA